MIPVLSPTGAAGGVTTGFSTTLGGVVVLLLFSLAGVVLGVVTGFFSSS